MGGCVCERGRDKRRKDVREGGKGGMKGGMEE